ncbi:MAG: D-alanyl-D-alanine carboxypeptidase/D-alanyl-D-alanine-endopeptidase (penicillin-binding protein 4) [Psychromonas sp.]|jgi:D-alanyl-D-alanine carboxypeptidase/D-alanyl-D-alanine-endopeptidase (penicillin-binding protein 4)
MKYLIIGIALLYSLNSCRVQKASKTLFELSKEVQHHFAYLFIDIASGDTLGKENAEKYFIPASTTKLFTWYASLSLLNDSLPAFRYVETLDSLVFWGTGDPSFLRTGFHKEKAFDFFKSRLHKSLIFSDSNFDENSSGKGWMLDDNLEAYQTEVSPFPMYGNLVSFQSHSINPPYFKSFTSKINGLVPLSRSQDKNEFSFGSQFIEKDAYIPYITSGQLTALLLADTLKSVISYENIPLPKEVKTLYASSRDSLLIPMLKYSDNMLAEQLLLLCSQQLSDTLKIAKAINYMLSHELSLLPQKPRWVDGSGLSRYNLFSPEDLVFLLEKVRRTLGQAETFAFLPSNGHEGTLGQFNEKEETFIYAKSGSMSGVYNLAGYLKTSSGRILAFAVMNNNFTKSVSSVRAEVAQFLLKVRADY